MNQKRRKKNIQKHFAPFTSEVCSVFGAFHLLFAEIVVNSLYSESISFNFFRVDFHPLQLVSKPCWFTTMADVDPRFEEMTRVVRRVFKEHFEEQ